MYSYTFAASLCALVHGEKTAREPVAGPAAAAAAGGAGAAAGAEGVAQERFHVRHGVPAPHGVAAQIEFESKVGKQSSCCSFKCLVPGAFNVGLIGSTCTALPWGGRPPRRRRPGPGS